MSTNFTKTKKLEILSPDINLDRAEVTMSELIRISTRKGRRYQIAEPFHDDILRKNPTIISKDSPKMYSPTDSAHTDSANERSIYYPKVKLNNATLVLDEESIIMRPGRDKIQDSSQIRTRSFQNSDKTYTRLIRTFHYFPGRIFETTNEISNSKLKQQKRYKFQHWTESETHLFFKALSQFGTDFSMIQKSLFPLRNRIEIKNKFKREERQHPTRVNRALRSRIPVMEFLTNEKDGVHEEKKSN